MNNIVSASAALGIAQAHSVSDASAVFIGLYLILFSGIVVFQDCVGLCKVRYFETLIKKNFGFLFGPIGKGCYFIL